ncbi:MAG: hypothetical protein U9Q15_00095 [Patescibacteria group bacterium]|nr:hypothetical protein [Patescibacteria group bacterium]
MDQRETLVAQGFTEIQDLLNQKICQTTNSQKEYSKICDTLVIDQIDNIMAQMVAQSPEYSIDVNDAVRGHLLSSDKKVEKEIVLSTMLRGQYLLDGAQMRFHTMDIDKRESILMDTYLALALLNGGVADLLVAASSETGNASTYFASQTFEIGFQKYEPDNEWIDCDKDLNTSLTYGYKNFYSPSCNCSDPGFKLFDEDMWAEEWNAMMEEIDAVQTTGFSFLNLFLWKEGDYQGDDFVERVWGYTKSVLYGTAYVLTLGFIDQWTKAEPEDYVCVYEDGVNGSCWESRVKDETK